MDYVLEIDVKDGKYRYRIDNIFITYYYNNKPLDPTSIESIYDEYKKKPRNSERTLLIEYNAAAKNAIESIKSGMKKQVSNDW